MTTRPIDTIFRLKRVSEETGTAKSTLYLRITQGLHTPPITIGARSVGWPSSEIAALNAARIAGKTDAEIRQLVRRLVEGRNAR
jgi:prophage regulatory protein